MRANIYLVAAIVVLTGAVAAAEGPIEKGSLLLDGSLYFQSQSGELFVGSDDESVTTFAIGSVDMSVISLDISPTIGYFIANGVCIGAQFGFQSFSFGDDDKVSIFAIGPSVGYYVRINPASEDSKGAAYVYGRGFFSFGSVKDEDDSGPDITQYGGNLGLIYMVSSAVGADVSVKFQQDSWKDEGDTATGTTVRFGVGLTAFIF